MSIVNVFMLSIEKKTLIKRRAFESEHLSLIQEKINIQQNSNKGLKYLSSYFEENSVIQIYLFCILLIT